MFPLFPQLPRDIRRLIWLATLGPMTLTFTKKEPGKKPVHVVSENGSGEEKDQDTWSSLYGLDRPDHWKVERPDEIWDSSEELCEPPEDPNPEAICDSMAFPDDDDVALEKLFANVPRYCGHVALADGSSRIQFIVEPSAAYLACKESRDFLSFIFAEPVRPSGGLPSWFCFDVDTIRCTNWDFYTIRNHAWFTQTQHLVIAVSLTTSYYFELYDDEPWGDERDEQWIATNLPVIKNIMYEMKYAETYGVKPFSHWLDQGWIQLFEEWYDYEYDTKPVSWYTRVISPQVPEEEWLTPTNYLRVYKLVQQARKKVFFPDEDQLVYGGWKRIVAILKATDEELDNPTEYLKKHRPSWDE